MQTEKLIAHFNAHKGTLKAYKAFVRMAQIKGIYMYQLQQQVIKEAAERFEKEIEAYDKKKV